MSVVEIPFRLIQNMILNYLTLWLKNGLSTEGDRVCGSLLVSVLDLSSPASSPG